MEAIEKPRTPRGDIEEGEGEWERVSSDHRPTKQ